MSANIDSPIQTIIKPSKGSPSLAGKGRGRYFDYIIPLHRFHWQKSMLCYDRQHNGTM